MHEQARGAWSEGVDHAVLRSAETREQRRERQLDARSRLSRSRTQWTSRCRASLAARVDDPVLSAWFSLSWSRHRLGVCNPRTKSVIRKMKPTKRTNSPQRGRAATDAMIRDTACHRKMVSIKAASRGANSRTEVFLTLPFIPIFSNSPSNRVQDICSASPAR